MHQYIGAANYLKLNVSAADKKITNLKICNDGSVSSPFGATGKVPTIYWCSICGATLPVAPLVLLQKMQKIVTTMNRMVQQCLLAPIITKRYAYQV
jgi:hypothetical protein